MVAGSGTSMQALIFLDSLEFRGTIALRIPCLPLAHTFTCRIVDSSQGRQASFRAAISLASSHRWTDPWTLILTMTADKSNPCSQKRVMSPCSFPTFGIADYLRGLVIRGDFFSRPIMGDAIWPSGFARLSL